MRKIEIEKYTCPKCNAALAILAEDLMVGSKLTTKYKCQGCQEEFYSIEYVDVLDAKIAPKLLCPFCGKDTDYLLIRNSWTDYWKCLPCKSTFEQSYAPNHEGLTTIQMYTTIRNNLYVLRQFLALKKSRVELLPENLDDTVVIAQEFAFLMPNITPDNIQEKLMTYLVFS